MFKDRAEEEEYDYENETEFELRDQIRFSKIVEEFNESLFSRPRPNPDNLVETARWSRENRKKILGK